ncbi:MAG: formylglycine-generating enzyme family protein, partial [Acidobacteriota bacterium]
IRTEFLLDKVGWVAEADLLLSDLCREVGYETYVLDEDVRALLLKQGRESLGAERLKEVAHRVYNYLSHVVYTSPLLTTEDLKAQRWEAMVYLDRHRDVAAKEMADSFAAAGGVEQTGPVPGAQSVNWGELARIAHLVQGVREQLLQNPSGELARLVEYAAAASQIADLRAGFLHPSRLQLQNLAEQFEVMGTRLASPDALLEKARGEERQRKFVAEEASRDGFFISVAQKLLSGVIERELTQLPTHGEVVLRIHYTILVSNEDDSPWQDEERENLERVLRDFAEQRAETLLANRPADKLAKIEKLTLNLNTDDALTLGQIKIRSNWSYTEDLSDGVMLEMVYVSGGEFLMGSEVDSSEQPIHRVIISPFFIGKFQITQSQWQAVMGKNPSRLKGDKLPVESVSWNDAVEFCQRLSSAKKTDRAYRLPTEAEWEYACRSGSTDKYCFGNDEDLLEQYAWYDKNSGSTTHQVGEKKANDFGLYDMHGNVWEWCEDVWHTDYTDSPTDGSAWLSGGDSGFRVLRGGSWVNYGYFCRSSLRNSLRPGDRDFYMGFRVVVSARTSGT